MQDGKKLWQNRNFFFCCECVCVRFFCDAFVCLIWKLDKVFIVRKITSVGPTATTSILLRHNIMRTKPDMIKSAKEIFEPKVKRKKNVIIEERFVSLLFIAVLLICHTNWPANLIIIWKWPFSLNIRLGFRPRHHSLDFLSLPRSAPFILLKFYNLVLQELNLKVFPISRWK